MLVCGTDKSSNTGRLLRPVDAKDGMELIDYLRMLRRRWLFVVTFTVLGLLAATTYLTTTTRTYQASSELFFGNDRIATVAGAQSTSNYTLDRMPSYAALIRSAAVLQRVRDQSGTGLSTGQLSSRVSASVVSKTVLLRVTAQDSDPARAVKIADAAALSLGAVVEQIERPAAGAASVITPTITSPATRPSSPSSPNRRLVLALGLVLGLGLGLLAAALRDQALQTRSSVRSAEPPGNPASPVADGADRAPPSGRESEHAGSTPSLDARAARASEQGRAAEAPTDVSGSTARS